MHNTQKAPSLLLSISLIFQGCCEVQDQLHRSLLLPRHPPLNGRHHDRVHEHDRHQRYYNDHFARGHCPLPSVEIMITTVTTTTATTMATEPNNNNNNNGGGGGGGSGPGNNNNNMNSRSLFGNSKWQPHKSSHLRQKTKGDKSYEKSQVEFDLSN